MATITFTMEFDENGDAKIRLPEGKSQQVNAAKVSKLTESLAKAIGTITERHIGHHHDHDHAHDHNHENA
jgi:hypothetical protein